MKRVWKCDFCYHTEVLQEKMKKHEEECSSNPIFKKCWSCKFHEDYYESFICKSPSTIERNDQVKITGVKDQKKDHWDYEDDGNCPEWQSNDEKLLRKIKIENINKSIS